MTPNSQQRHLITGATIVIALIAVVIGVLGFAHAWYLPKEADAPHCFATFATSQFPKWLGCAMAAHENLAGGLIGAAGALFAAWIAFTTVQRQMEEEAARFQQQMQAEAAARKRAYDEAKAAAIAALVQPVWAAADTLRAIRSVVNEPSSASLDPKAVDEIFQLVGRVDVALDNFVLREIARDLSVDDRARYIHIISALTALVAIKKPEQLRDVDGRLLTSTTSRDDLLLQQQELERMCGFLLSFDPELGKAFEKDTS